MITTVQSFFKIWNVSQARMSSLHRAHANLSVCSFAQSCPILCDHRDVASQAPLSVEFSRQEYWNGLPFPTLGNLPDSRIKPTSLVSPALAGGKLQLAQCCKESLYCASFNICSSEAISHFFKFLILYWSIVD